MKKKRKTKLAIIFIIATIFACLAAPTLFLNLPSKEEISEPVAVLQSEEVEEPSTEQYKREQIGTDLGWEWTVFLVCGFIASGLFIFGAVYNIYRIYKDKDDAKQAVFLEAEGFMEDLK